MRRAPFIVVAPLVAGTFAGCKEDAQVIRNPAPPIEAPPTDEKPPVAAADAGPVDRPERAPDINRNPPPPSPEDLGEPPAAKKDDEGGW